MGIEPIDGHHSANGKRFALVASRWNNSIVSGLISSATRTLCQSGVCEGDIELFRVPGSFEIPAAVSHLLRAKKFDAVISLGCLIRGETDHYSLIASSVTDALMRLSVESSIPVTFGVVTADDLDQAQARSRDDHANKGREAAIAAIEMLCAFERIDGFN